MAGKGKEKDLTQRAQRLRRRGHGEFVVLLDGRGQKGNRVFLWEMVWSLKIPL